MVLVPYSCL
uniref:Uncharacterized protein n=1 Tax=Arundo donax TaxID=35708 RepID=A0A0A8ZC04_ARUDO